MWTNCTEHFAATLKILEPTIVILQGAAVATWATASVKPGRIYDQHTYEAYLDGTRMIACAFSHPSAHRALRWGDNPTPTEASYLTTVVEPTLLKALQPS
jgi:hypothetical protein